MKSKKGFTLIELLAVIVILAIIALIATPIIVELIKNSRISSAENATHGILKAAEVYYGNVVLENQGVFNDNATMEIDFAATTDTATVKAATTSTLNRIQYDGTQAKAGSITIDRYGVITIIKPLKVNNYYCAYKDGSVNATRVVRCAEDKIKVDCGTNDGSDPGACSADY